MIVLLNDLMIHFSLTERVLQITEELFSSIYSLSEDSIQNKIENRQRIINSINNYQVRIEKLINQFPSIREDNDIKDTLITWAHQTNNITERVRSLDSDILEKLEQKHQELKTEIVTVNKNKKSISGYSLGSVKR